MIIGHQLAIRNGGALRNLWITFGSKESVQAFKFPCPNVEIYIYIYILYLFLNYEKVIIIFQSGINEVSNCVTGLFAHGQFAHGLKVSLG